MKRNIISGAMLVAVMAFASCSTQKLASNSSKNDDDVYYSQAKAGDQPEIQEVAYRQDVYNAPDDDYYYYDSYASRINRFGYFSPFNYYDDYYYDYSPYSSYGWNAYAYGNYGYGLGLGFGLGYGYPYGYAYSPWGYGYSPYSVWGLGYGGGYPFWGIYSAYGGYGGYGNYASNGRPRPYRGSGAPGGAFVNRSVRGVGYNGAYPTTSYYPGRAVNGNGRTSTNSYGGNYNNSAQRPSRPTRNDYPTYQPPSRTSNSAPSSSGGNSGGGSSSGGGGARPSRP